MSTSEIATVLAWHDALVAGDLETLEKLSSDDIEVADADGAAQGHQALRRWAASVQTTTGIGRMYVHNGVVVAELTPAGEGSRQAVAFRVVHDHVTAVFRHDDLDTALSATDLTEADRVD
ncbi:nuclear transport factor 2 family protein [[Mycobacterium] crassicus]|uniref:Nuclear transport factor 2 family protein n=1 Tax=[Mycobacterium] crassicus TaxID=2872309 RepID=A0ABU5XE11_9MYCO|nr:nuclear transport factor 2 family protein [Mycolicibacter sp. MYC098]MEB3020398.1 nuclear transport factor 2 family protein [Mycolicibacter sp. MYC098]